MSTIYWHIPISSKFAYKQISHRSTEGMSLEGTFGGLLVQPHCSSRVTTAEFTGLCPDGFLSNSKDERPHTYTNEPCVTIYLQLNIYRDIDDIDYIGIDRYKNTFQVVNVVRRQHSVLLLSSFTLTE